jgi:hypothetical protein
MVYVPRPARTLIPYLLPLVTSPSVRNGLCDVFPVLHPCYFLDQIRALMDKPTNIRNMSVIAHGTSICALTSLII